MRDYYAEGMGSVSVGAAKVPFSDMFTPDELRNDILSLNRRVKSFGDDEAGPPSDDAKILAYRAKFAPWYNEYFAWFAQVEGDPHWYSYRLNSTRDKARAYADQLEAWIKEWKALGGTVVSPTATGETSKDIGGRGRDQKDSTPLWKIGLGVGIVAAIVLGTYAWASGSGGGTKYILPDKG